MSSVHRLTGARRVLKFAWFTLRDVLITLAIFAAMVALVFAIAHFGAEKTLTIGLLCLLGVMMLGGLVGWVTANWRESRFP